jgi:hypothetical protein
LIVQDVFQTTSFKVQGSMFKVRLSDEILSRDLVLVFNPGDITRRDFSLRARNDTRKQPLL